MGMVIPAFLLGVVARLESVESWDIFVPVSRKMSLWEGLRPWHRKAGGSHPQTDEELRETGV